MVPAKSHCKKSSSPLHAAQVLRFLLREPARAWRIYMGDLWAENKEKLLGLKMKTAVGIAIVTKDVVGINLYGVMEKYLKLIDLCGSNVSGQYRKVCLFVINATIPAV